MDTYQEAARLIGMVRRKRQMQRWGVNIDRIMTEKGLTSSDVGFKPQQLSDLKRQPAPNIATLQKFAHHAGVDIADLFADGEGSRPIGGEASSGEAAAVSRLAVSEAIEDALYHVLTYISDDLGKHIAARTQTHAGRQTPITSEDPASLSTRRRNAS